MTHQSFKACREAETPTSVASCASCGSSGPPANNAPVAKPPDATSTRGAAASGGAELTPEDYKDMEKYNTALLHGWRVYRTTPKMLTSREVITDIVYLCSHKPIFSVPIEQINADNA